MVRIETEEVNSGQNEWYPLFLPAAQREPNATPPHPDFQF